MSMVFVCGNCEMSPCECTFEADNDFSLNLKLKPGKYYKKMHWPDELYFQVGNLGRGYYVHNAYRVGEQVLSSN